MQAYSNPKRENDPYALPDLEIFEADAGEWGYDKNGERIDADEADDDTLNEGGWYCLPGCLPDSDAYGPFETSDEALAAARDDAGNDEDEPSGLDSDPGYAHN